MSFCNKVGYPSKLDARLAAARQTKSKTRAYYCEIHNAWHWTNRRKPREKSYWTTKSASPEWKRLLRQKAEKAERRQLRDISKRYADRSRQDSGETLLEER